MILTGSAIAEAVEAGRIEIDPFDAAALEPNSYGFRLGHRYVVYDDDRLETTVAAAATWRTIDPAGMLLEPHRLYLGETHERIGSLFYAMTLFSRLSTSLCGIWIQISAELGHTGPAIPWTLELRATHPVVVYPEMKIGKIAFWETQGDRLEYAGRYATSATVLPSLLYEDDSDRP